MVRCVCRFTLIGVLLLASACRVYDTPKATDGASSNIDAVISCTRDAEVRQTNPRFHNVDRCEGSYTIQGISYRCGRVGDVATKTYEFLNTLNQRARTRCEQLCRERGRGCEGSYRDASKCGFSVPTSRATMVGTKIVGCHPNCEGTAFIYCSLYHGSYFRIEDHLFEDMEPNCYCRRAR